MSQLPFFFFGGKSGLQFSAFFYGTCSGYGPYMKKEGIDTFPSKEILYCFSEIHSLGKLGGVKLEFLDALRVNSPSCILAFCSFRMLS